MTVQILKFSIFHLWWRSRMDTRGLPEVVSWRRLKWQSKFTKDFWFLSTFIELLVSDSIHDHTLKATQMTMANYYYKQKFKRLKRNNNCFIWSKIFLISVFLWCVPSSSNLFWKFEHKLDTVLPPKSPNDHQFRFH